VNRPTRSNPATGSTRPTAAVRRTWDLHLAFCGAGFATRYLDVAQIRFERGGAEAVVA
jgi:cyclopropane fatty-acyl-phospholipid synthase-like methyltransferase